MIGFVVTFHYPLNHHPARLAAEHLEGFWFGWTSISRAFSVAQTFLFVATSLAVAMVVRSPVVKANSKRWLAWRAAAAERSSFRLCCTIVLQQQVLSSRQGLACAQFHQVCILSCQ